MLCQVFYNKLSSFAISVSRCLPNASNDDLREFSSTTEITDRASIAEEVYTQIKLMNEQELTSLKSQLAVVVQSGQNTFEDEEEDEICQLCGAIR